MNAKHSRVKMKHEFYLFCRPRISFFFKVPKSAQIASHHEIRHAFNDIVLYNLNKDTKKFIRVKNSRLNVFSKQLIFAAIEINFVVKSVLDGNFLI